MLCYKSQTFCCHVLLINQGCNPEKVILLPVKKEHHSPYGTCVLQSYGARIRMMGLQFYSRMENFLCFSVPNNVGYPWAGPRPYQYQLGKEKSIPAHHYGYFKAAPNAWREGWLGVENPDDIEASYHPSKTTFIS